MTALSDVLQKFFKFLCLLGIPLPDPMLEVRIVEIGPKTIMGLDGRPRVRRDDLLRPSEYAERFEKLMRLGFAWVNVRYYGIDDASVVVGVETPRAPDDSAETVVQYSGPTVSVMTSHWRVDAVLVIE